LNFYKPIKKSEKSDDSESTDDEAMDSDDDIEGRELINEEEASFE